MIRRFLPAFLLLFTFHSGLYSQAGTWATSFGGAFFDEATDMLTDASGNAYLTGYFQDSLFLPGDTLISRGSNDFFVASFDNGGNLRWAKNYGWGADDFARVMTLDASNNLYIAGEFRDSCIFGTDTVYTTNSISNFDSYVMRLDLSGNYDTVFTVDSTAASDFIYGLAADNSGDLVLTGKFRVQAVFGTDTLNNVGFDDWFLAKMDPDGNFLWARSAGGRLNETGTDIAIVGDTAYYVSGYFQDTCFFNDSTTFRVSEGGEDGLLVKYSSNGEFRWAKSGGSTGADRFNGLELLGNEIYIGGYFDSTFTYGAATLTTTNRYDGLAIKTDLSGNETWMRQMGGQQFDAVTDIVATSGAVHLVGYFQGPANFGTLPPVFTNGAFNSQIFVTRLDASGNFVWVSRGRGPSTDEGSCLTVDPSGFTWAAGIFVDSCSFGQAVVHSVGLQDVVLTRLDAAGKVDREDPKVENQQKITVFPNPSSGEIHLAIDFSRALPVEIQVTNLAGEVVLEHQETSIGTSVISLQVPGLPDGLYVLRVICGEEIRVGKFSVQR